MSSTRAPALLAALLATGASALDAGPENLLDRRVTLTSPGGQQSSPTAVTIDGGYFVIWEDRRESDGLFAVYGARIGLDGGVTPDGGRRLIAAGETPWGAGVDCSASGCLVAYNDTASVLRGIVVTLDAVPVDAGALSFAGDSTQGVPAVSAGAGRYLVAYASQSGTPSLRGVELYESGAPSSISFLISSVTTNEIAAAFDGAQWVVAWKEQTGATTYQGKAIRIAAASPLQPFTLPPCGDSASLTVACAGIGECVVAQNNASLNGTVLSVVGVAPPIQGSITFNADAGITGSNPGIVATGPDYLVSFYKNGLWLGAESLTAGKPAPVQVVSDFFAGSTSLSSGRAPLFVWRQPLVDLSDPRDDLFRAVVNPTTPALGPPHRLVDTAQQQREPAAAYCGDRWVTLWDELFDGVGQMVGAQLRADGTAIPGVHGAMPSPRDQGGVAVTWDGTRCWLAWWERDSTSNAVRIESVDAGGNLLVDAHDLALYPSRIRAASGPEGTLFAWSYYTGVVSDDVMLVRVDQSGALIDATPQDLTPVTGYQQDPAVAYGSGAYLVAWRDETAPNIKVRRIGAHDTFPLDGGAQGFYFSPYVKHVDVASDGTGFLVVWNETAMPGTVKAALLDANAQVIGLDQTLYSDQSSDTWVSPGEPAVAWDGAQYLVLYTVARHGGTDVMLQTVQTDGTPSSPQVIALGAQHPALSPGIPGQVLALYSVFDETLAAGRVASKQLGLIVTLPDAGSTGGGAGGGSSAGGGSGAGGGGADVGGGLASTGGGAPQLERQLGVRCGCSSGSGAWAALALLWRRPRREQRAAPVPRSSPQRRRRP